VRRRNTSEPCRLARLAVIAYNGSSAEALGFASNLLTARPSDCAFIFHMPGRLVHHARQLSLRLGTARGTGCAWTPSDLTASFLAFPGTGLIDGFAERFLEALRKIAVLRLPDGPPNLHACSTTKSGSRSELTCINAHSGCQAHVTATLRRLGSKDRDCSDYPNMF